MIVDTDTAEGEDDQDDSSADDDLTPEQQAARAEASAHSAIVANLERMQADLATLLTRWKSAAPNEPDLDQDEAEVAGSVD